MIVGGVTIYVTLNELEMYIKADNGRQGWSDTLAMTASLARQHGCPWRTIARHWLAQRFEPEGIAGQGASIPDAIARWLMEVDGE